jgi:CO/xanthine dehydrogenase Mo-binding subunit
MADLKNNNSIVGKRMPRHDAELQVTGRSRYTDDLQFPGMLHGYVLRSEHAHARILNISTDVALRTKGVWAIITHKDVPHNRFGIFVDDQPLLVDDKVRHFGDPVAVVAADSLRLASEAAKLIKVDYELLAGVFDPLVAMESEAPLIHENSNIAKHIQIMNGDVESGFLEADEIVEESFMTQRVEHGHIETHVGIAEMTNNGHLLIHASVGRPFTIAADLSKLLRIPQNRIQVTTDAIGGAFGGKNEITIEPLLAILAMKTGRPVKMSFNREDEFIASTIRHPYIMKYKSGVKKDGRLTAREVEIIGDTGAYVSWGVSTMTKACVHCCGPYNIPNTRVNGYVVYTNNPISGAMRGFGVPQVGFAYEVHMNSVAKAIGLSPVEIRMKNILKDNDILPVGQVLPIVTIEETIQRALRIYQERKAERS